MKRLLQTASLCLMGATSTAHALEDDYGYGAGTGYAAQTLDERVARLEKKISGQGMVEMVTRLDRMQSEISKLHGKMEELQHHIDNLQKQQQTMVSDMEQRLSQGQAGGSAVGSDVTADGSMEPASHTTSTATAAAAASSTAAEGGDAARQAAYQKGFALLKDGKYDESIKEFKAFIQKYPKGEYADTSLYWLGEAQYVNRDFAGARDTFHKLMKDFPQNSKVADAQLKLGYIEYDLGDMTKARDALNEVVKRYPGSNAARLAEKRLEKIKTEKH